MDDLAYYSQYSLDLPNDSELEFVMVDGENKDYNKESDHIYRFEVKLKNLEISTIHYKYKHKKELEEEQLDYQQCYGISREAGNTTGKYALINKGSYDIVKFSELFLVRNENNENDVEYIWSGRVPSDGKETYITFTKKEARWLYDYSIKLKSSTNITWQFSLFVPVYFTEGNNIIINCDYNSPQTKDISINKKAQEYVIRFNNCKTKNAEFYMKIEFLNKSDDWSINISDEKIRRLMPKQDVKDKTKLQSIAKDIIKDFDNKHKNSEYKYLDFMKIGFWVHNNLKYDHQYLGRENYSALDIYKMKKGVCYHYTRLSNALLYSLGYKVIFAIGYCYHGYSFNYRNLHAWSLVKIGNKWYAFDSTKGIITGKLPITHVYRNYVYTDYSYNGSKNYYVELQGTGKYIGQ